MFGLFLLCQIVIIEFICDLTLLLRGGGDAKCPWQRLFDALSSVQKIKSRNFANSPQI